MIPLKTPDTYYIIPERSNTEKGSEGPGLVLSAGAHTIFLLEREDLGMSMLLCPSLPGPYTERIDLRFDV
jgi:hypothetical protein